MRILSELKKQREHAAKEIDRTKYKIQQMQEWVELEETKVHELDVIIKHFEGEQNE
ncbi:MAG: hypothetical protein ACQET8_23015 [Bacillota bacterium]